MKNLTPMKNPTAFETIIAIDIETSSEGELLDIGCYTQLGNDIYNGYHTHLHWKDFFECLLQYTGNIRVIAHNGFGFDYIGFYQWFLENRKKYNIPDDNIVHLSSESLMIGLIINTEKAKLSFVDTMRYFPGQSLQKLAESYLDEGKDDVPENFISHMEDYKLQYRNKYYAYLRRDCEILYRIYCKFRQEINEFTDIGEIGLSAGSTAMKSFRRYLHKTRSSTQIFSSSQEYNFLADYAMRGGLTLYIGDGLHISHRYGNVYHYDVVSMYPTVMKNVPAPTSPMIYTEEIIKDFDDYRPGWYLCNYEQIRGRVPILFAYDSEYPQWSGQGVLSHFDLQFLDEYGQYEIIDGLVYDDYLYPFKDYFDDLLDLRMKAKKDKLTAKSHALKILANSLYGKFGQRAYREVIAITSDRDWYDSMLEARLRDYGDTGITEYVVRDDYVIYGVESNSTSFSNRFIGAMVTSLARIKLGMLYNTYNTIYCDTDSIFTQKRFDRVWVGEFPGLFEESSESPNEMICLGKKSYQYGNDIKFKGVPSKNITNSDIANMRIGLEVEIKYKSPTSWKTAIKKNIENPNKFLPQARKVKRGKSLNELEMLHLSAELFEVKETKEFLDSLLML